MSKPKAKSKRTIDPNLFMAKLAEQGERYHDVFEFLEVGLAARVEDCHYTPDERNML